MNRLHLLSILILTVFLSACALAQPDTSQQPTQISAAGQPAQTPSKLHMQLSDKTDQQGAVTVVARPLHWETGGETIDFEIAMDTHSVDLSFDLTPLSTLTTDTGINVSAIRWQAPSGGHHVTGTLSFPAQVDGKAVLKDIGLLTLTIENMDVPERVFTWQVFR